MDVRDVRWITADDSHLWHCHVSAYRNTAGVHDAMDDLADAILGATSPPSEDDDMSQADVDWIKAELTELRRITASLLNPDFASGHTGQGELTIADQVTRLGMIGIRPYAGHPQDFYTLEVTLSETLDVVRTIRDAVAPDYRDDGD